jgi:transglutaminase-like putative cysteine protease
MLLAMFSCTGKRVSLEEINVTETAGNFTDARRLIDLYIAENNLSDEQIYDFYFHKDRLKRIEIDFNKSKEDVVSYIKKYYPDVNDEMLEKWQTDGSLESMVIDGERKYFDRSAPNLFRINKEAVKRKIEVDANTKPDSKSLFLQNYIQQTINTLKGKNQNQTKPVEFKVKYTVTLNPNVVPAGETVRCWLPYPNENSRRQSDIKFISSNAGNYIISPKEYAHRSFYMEKIAEKDLPTEFSVEFSYKSAAEWFEFADSSIKPYNIDNEEYKKYTSERPPHIVFSDSIKKLSEKIIADESDPYTKVKKIFTYIDENYPWAGAREYSTIPNIPEYVIRSGHGDCGQVTLLFITLARYNGIPAKWESGFNFIPGSVNLHDWGSYYLENVGWIPVDQSFGINGWATNADGKYFYMSGTDAYHFVVNTDYSQPLYPAKTYPRSETVDFQRGELEWRGGNIYFDQWKWDVNVGYE